jgi:Mg2+/Co2+ transporter CorB
MAHMQNAPSYILGLALVVLLLLIAFSSGTEVAMLSANRYKDSRRRQGR